MSKRTKVEELKRDVGKETMQKRESPRIRNRTSYAYDDDIWEPPQNSSGRKSPSRRSSYLSKSKGKATGSPGRSGRTRSSARAKTPEQVDGSKRERGRVKSRIPARSKSSPQRKSVVKDVVAPNPSMCNRSRHDVHCSLLQPQFVLKSRGSTKKWSATPEPVMVSFRLRCSSRVRTFNFHRSCLYYFLLFKISNFDR